MMYNTAASSSASEGAVGAQCTYCYIGTRACASEELMFE